MNALTVIVSLLLLRFNASAISAQNAAPKVLRGSSQIISAEELIDDARAYKIVKEANVQEENKEFVQTQCLGHARLCSDNSLCCNGLVCSRHLCVSACDGEGSFCIKKFRLLFRAMHRFELPRLRETICCYSTWV